MDSEEIADIGVLVLTLGGLAVAYFVCNALFGSGSSSSNNKSRTPKYTSDLDSISEPDEIADYEKSESVKKESKELPCGCLLGGILCLFIIGFIVHFATASSDVNYGVGVIAVIVIVAIIGFALYNSFKD